MAISTGKGNSMAQNLKACVVQIQDADSTVHGTGFIIDANTTVTCAHVVEAAGATPGEIVTIAFALTGDTCQAKVLTDAWCPSDGDDIAILRLQSELPAGVFPAILGSSADTAGHSFRAFGYPEVGDIQGVWAEGKILGPITDSADTKILQLRSQEVVRGMSGGPILDTDGDRVVGMVTATYKPLSGDFGLRDMVFAASAEAIAQVWSSLELTPASKNMARDIIFQKFTEAPRTLSHHIRIRDFQNLINERTRNFVGRDFIFKAIDNYIRDPDFLSGYIVISGEPGIGKTALLAQLVNQAGYVHHFNIASQNIRSHRDFLANICAQLIIRYELDTRLLPPEATRDSGFLIQLLTKVAAQEENQPVVILVDALDEAEDVGLAPNANRLYLPPTLPEGVFFVITSREEHDSHLAVDHCEDIFLGDNTPQNLEDTHQYVQNFVAKHRDQMTPRIKMWNVNEDEFIDVIVEKSQGNFMYLVYVLQDIRTGKLTATNIDNIRKLPRGLRTYYQHHWRSMKAQDEEQFKNYYQPAVCILATVREPVSIGQVAEWTKLDPISITKVIQTWREFLNEDEDEEGAPLYRIYHTSFQDFLNEEVGLKYYHELIARNAISKIPTK